MDAEEKEITQVRQKNLQWNFSNFPTFKKQNKGIISKKAFTSALAVPPL